MTRLNSLFGSVLVAGVATLVLAAALATLINVITADAPPLPGLSCKRDCQPGENLICNFDFDVHRYQTYSRTCNGCEGGDCPPGCIRGDGTTRFITVVNRMLPGPSIEVCEGDIIRVNVRNQLPAEGVSIHWHGLLQKGDTVGTGVPHMDGVPGVTQCPITAGTSFTYTLKASPAGTHLWYAQTGFQRGDGVFGALVVRRPKYEEEVHSHLYDEDFSSHVIVINDWTHILTEEKFCLRHLGKFSDLPQSLLVNGIGPHEGESITAIPKPVPHKRFRVIKGRRHRFRLGSAAFLNCPIEFSIEKHKVTLISVDGSPVSPTVMDSISIYPGERIDVVVEANRSPGPYWMIFKGRADCAKASVFQLAILDYVDEYKEKENRKLKPYRKPYLATRDTFQAPLYENIKSVTPMMEDMKREKADETFYLFFNRRKLRGIENHPFFSNHFSADDAVPIPQINNVTFRRPSSPLLQNRHPARVCRSTVFCEEVFCECIHMKKIKLGSLVDLVIVDEDEHSHGNVVHLHGHRFHVIGSGYAESHSKSSYRFWESLYANQSLVQNIEDPMMKDTVFVPPKGYVLLRFLADNPGFWALQSQLLFYSEAGMKMVFMVGEDYEIPALPRNFPHCGNYL